MNDKEVFPVIIVLFIGVLFGALFGGFAVRLITENKIQRDAAAHHAGRFIPFEDEGQTKFEWTGQKPSAP